MASARPRRSKHTVPDNPPGLLRRPRLVDFIHQNINRKLVLIAAAAGYGKTSLVADFAHDTDFPVAWCSLDETDRDLAVFAADLVAAMRVPFPQFGGATAGLLSEAGGVPQAEQLATALASEIDDTIPGYFVLCLDDLHVVQDSEAVARFLARLLYLLPEQAHLLVCSRAIPPVPFPIVPLAARQEIAGLSEEQLSFTPAEVQALLQMRSAVSMPEAEAEKLVANTEGWITGILLSSHLMWQGLMASWLRAQQAAAPVYDYLAEEVLAGQPERLRQFLLESAVLPEMEAEACDAVLGRRDSAEMLHRAEAQRLFITGVGDEARTFSFHQLFRDFLLARLQATSPGRLRDLQRRAGEWYEAQGWPETAVTFFMTAGDIHRAVAIGDTTAGTLFRNGQHETLRRWAEQLAAVALEAPTLHLYLFRVQADAGNLSAATKMLEIAAAGYNRLGDDRGRVSVDVQRIILAHRQGRHEEALNIARTVRPRAQSLGELVLAARADRYAGLCHFGLGHLAFAEESLQQAASLFDNTQQQYDRAWALHDLARVYRASGKTARAALAQQEALNIWRERGNLGPLAAALNNVGWDQHMLGQYEAALATYAEALKRARQAGSGPVEILVLAGQGDLLADLGDLGAAADLYRRAIAVTESLREAGFIGYLYRAYARLEQRIGNFAAALEWLRRCELAPVSSQAESAGTNTRCLRGAILLEMGQGEEALALLSEACAELEQAGAAVDLVSGLFSLARAQWYCGSEADALASLRRAFASAEQVGYDQVLVAEAHSARDLLEAAQSEPALRQSVTSLLARADAARGLLTRRRAGEMPLPQPRPAAIEVHALGGSRILRDGAELARGEWASQQSRELFLYVVDRVSVQKEEILEAFWPDKPFSRATANFHQTLYQARRAIGREAVEFQDSQYRLAPGLDLDYDVVRFERSARAALAKTPGDVPRAPALAAAIELYAGEYLADLPVEWAQERRRALCDLFDELLRDYADELMHLARYADARRVLARALVDEPLSDDLHALMLRCLAAMGRRHEVVEHYQHYRNKLRTDLGLDPPSELRELYARLIR